MESDQLLSIIMKFDKLTRRNTIHFILDQLTPEQITAVQDYLSAVI